MNFLAKNKKNEGLIFNFLNTIKDWFDPALEGNPYKREIRKIYYVGKTRIRITASVN